MFSKFLTTVCTVALLSAGSVAIAQDATTGGNVNSDGNTTTITSPATQENDQTQGSLSNQSNVGNGSNSNSSNNNTLGAGSNYTDNTNVLDQSNSGNTSNNSSTSIANQNGYVTSVPIIASAGTCLGSVGGTLSAAGIGIGTSKTIVDDACNERQQQQLDANIHAQEAVTRANSVRLLSELGLAPAALSLLCQDPSIRLALKAGLEPAVYGKVCAVYEPSLANISELKTISEY